MSATPPDLVLMERPAVGGGDLDTSIARGVAALLIINSHAEALYPRSWLADGGQLGIAIFFIAAGMGTTLSKSRRSAPFGVWFRNRLVRIYPSVWIVVLASVVLGVEDAERWGVREYFEALVYPISGYTFFAQILPFYALGYAIARWCTTRHLAGLVCGFGMLSVLSAIPDALPLYPSGRLQIGRLNAVFWWCCYFELYLVGMLYAAKRTTTAWQPRLARAGLLTATIAYLVLKYLMVVRGELAYAFVLLWVAVALWSVCLIECLTDAQLRSRIIAVPILGGAVVGVGILSLETFLVHTQILHAGILRTFAFPTNIFLLLALTLVLAWPVSALSSYVRAMVVAGSGRDGLRGRQNTNGAS